MKDEYTHEDALCDAHNPELDDAPECDGCGKPAIASSHGFNTCGRCDDYKIRGLSKRDFL